MQSHIGHRLFAVRAIILDAREPFAHILLQFLQVLCHLLLKEQLLEPGSPSHQVRKILLLGPLDVKKFSEKLLPNLDVPPPLEASFRLPAIPNLNNVHVGCEEEEVGSCSNTKVIQMLPPSSVFPHLRTHQPVSLNHLGEEDVLGQELEVNGLAKVNKLEGGRQLLKHFLHRPCRLVGQGYPLEQEIVCLDVRV